MMGKVEIGNFYSLTGDDVILFLQKCLVNSSSHFIRHWLPGQNKYIIFIRPDMTEKLLTGT